MSKLSGHRIAVYGLILWAAILPLAMAASDVMGGCNNSCCHSTGCGDCCQGTGAGQISACQCIVLPLSTFLVTSSIFQYNQQATPFLLGLANPSPPVFTADIFHPPKS